MANEYQLKKDSREISRNIPDDVLFNEILVCLPVKSLTIYKSVCKMWLNTIESNSFKEAHRRRHICDYSNQILFSPFESMSYLHKKTLSLLPSSRSFVPSLMKMTLRPLDVMLPSEMTQLNWPECKGWRCGALVSVFGPIKTTGIYCIVSGMGPSPFPYPLSAKISICNPATRDYKLANPFPSDETARFNTGNWCVHYGFGLAVDGDYKVVLVMTWGPTCSGFLSYVYSMKQGAWKKIVDSENAMVSRLDLRGKPYYPEIADFSSELCPQVFLNGCWHWMANFKDRTCNVLSFDVDNEVFKLVRGPLNYSRSVIIDDERIFGIVTVLNDHLAMVHHMYKESWTSDRWSEISVWMMMEYGDEESWTNVWKVNLVASPMITIVGISYSLREYGVHIHKIVFQDCYMQLVSCDEFGVVVENQSRLHTSRCIFWNNLGISAYSETLERLSPRKHSSGAA